MQNSINILEVAKRLEKIKLYNREENIIFDNIIRKITDINKKYNTNNYNKLEEIKKNIYNKFNTIKINHYNNELILNKNINLIIDTAQKVENLFSNITR